MDTGTVTAEAPAAQLQAKADFAEQQGKQFLAALAPELTRLELPRGGYVILNVGDGTYVTGTTRRAARDEFRRHYPDAIGWACRVEDLPGA